MNNYPAASVIIVRPVAFAISGLLQAEHFSFGINFAQGRQAPMILLFIQVFQFEMPPPANSPVDNKKAIGSEIAGPSGQPLMVRFRKLIEDRFFPIREGHGKS